MTNYTPQSSASDRIEAARKALSDLAQHEAAAIENIARGWGETREAATLRPAETARLFAALRALITPPSVGESEPRIATRIVGDSGLTFSVDRNVTMSKDALYGIVERAVRAGIQDAHETREPEVALRPTQEQMLRWLGIDCTIHAGNIFIPEQHIERED